MSTATVANPLDLLHPIFRDCVDPESVRYDLATPFVIGDYAYATDGRILVRCLTTPEISEAIEAGRKGRFPKGDAMCWSPAYYSPAPYPTPPLPDLPVCSECEGIDRVPVIKRDLEYFDEDGKCRYCDGTHVEDSYLLRFRIGDAVDLGFPYIRILNRHDAMLWPALEKPAESAVRFTLADSVEGLVMPLHPDSEKEAQ